YDVLVVGGGINGVGIARDLAGRGHRVVLVEQHDLASHTSSASTKLIHGGLRYLEHRAFSLVRKALQEREVLLRSAPHIMRPLRFVMPHDPSMRPEWLIRAGLFLYDHLARREVLPGSCTVDLRSSELGTPLQPRFRKGFVYSDGWVDDARLVVLAAVDAAEQGAHVWTRQRCVRVQRGADHWEAHVLDERVGGLRAVRARMLVNATGPWAGRFLATTAQGLGGEKLTQHSLRLVKGSHIVVPRLFDHDHAYLFQNEDGRIMFAIPYEGHFTLIGTTDVEVQGDPGAQAISQEEVIYLCQQASRYFSRELRPEDVRSSFAGVRPLLEDAASTASEVTRDYVLECDAQAAPLMTVWGGKMTTFRKLAEEAADQIGHMLGDHRPAWTQHASLPGGDLSPWIGPARRPDLDLQTFVAMLQQRFPWMPLPCLQRMARAYGSRVFMILGAATKMEHLGEIIAGVLTEAELQYLIDREWAKSAQDVLWRRSKLGLHFSAAQQKAVEAWFANKNHLGMMPQVADGW
ncbi:MAG TPA: glycerol-3-phosphate dehydrogenase, partial [Aquabacterium sp.]|nr:glycerol-3-phosphate dehydrogenase [Aquabacterium sp.]